jgi:hypothetical protein
MNTAGAKTALPVFADKTTVRCAFKGAKQDSNEKGDVLIFEFSTLDQAPSNEGGEIRPNFPIFHRIYLYDKDTPKGVIPERAITSVSRVVDACLGTGDADNKKSKPARPEFGPAIIPDMIGKEVFVTLKVRQDLNGQDQNEVSRVQHPSEVAA